MVEAKRAQTRFLKMVDKNHDAVLAFYR